MAHQLFAGLLTEGNTDNRFLESVVTRAFHEIAFECRGDIEIEVILLSKIASHNFVEMVRQAASQGLAEFGIMILCVHTDADAPSTQSVYEHKILPAQEALTLHDDSTHCKVVTPIVPVQMIESWMLADVELLKREIGTTKSDRELELDRIPESNADPKAVIRNAIQVAFVDNPKRRRRSLTIGELYAPIGQQIAMDKLKALASFQQFLTDLRTAFRACNLF